MDVVFNHKEVIFGRIFAVGGAGIYIFGLLDFGGIVIEVVLGVQVKVSDVVAHFYQIGGTDSVAGRIWWPHIRWNDTQDVAKCHFVVIYLVIKLRSG